MASSTIKPRGLRPARNGMATVTHYIRAEYDAQADTEPTGPVSEDAPDPWQTESSSAGFDASRRLAGAPKFVPALLSYDEWGNAAAPTYAEPTPTASEPPHGDVASWYRSLSRQGPSPTQPQPPSHGSSAARHQTSETITPKPSSSSSPSIASPALSSGSIHATGTPSSLSSLSPARSASRRQHWHRGGRDWFISRALSQSHSTSAPPSPRPNASSSSLVDILSRHGPSTTQPLRPPVFLHLGPSNKGWAMLQNQGWSEGEALGAGRTSLSSNDAHPKETKRRRTRPDFLSPTEPMLPTEPSQERPTKEEEEEVLIDDDDDDPIIEVRRKAQVPMIDLTQSDTEDETEDDEDEDNRDTVTVNENNNDAIDSPAPTSDRDHDPRGAQTALLTPLPTILKSDRLGIGLKAKTEGPYRASVKRRDAARSANAAAVAEDMRRRLLLGKGHRAFARAERLERERRQNMMAYLSEP